MTSPVSVQRSPAKVCWWVMFNGYVLETADTKWQAQELAETYRRKVS